MKYLINSLIETQLNKLDSKLQFLEEYEKLVIYERNQLEVFQRYNIAESVNLAYKKNELNK